MIDNATEHQVKKMFLRFYEDEVDLCDQFLEKYRQLDMKNISTAQLQGLFVYNKRNPHNAIKMIDTLKNPNTVF